MRIRFVNAKRIFFTVTLGLLIKSYQYEAYVQNNWNDLRKLRRKSKELIVTS